MKRLLHWVRNRQYMRLTGEQNAERLRSLGYAIGERCSIPFGTALPLPDLIRIGDNVRMSSDVRVLPYDGSMEMLNRATGCRLDSVGAVVIRDNVFIGAGSFILKGVTLGPDVVVGCGSIVTHDFSRAVVAGNPARLIRGWEDHLEMLQSRTQSYPWHSLIANRNGAFDAAIEGTLNRARQAYFFAPRAEPGSA